MKNKFKKLLCLILSCLTALTIISCKKNYKEINLYVVDGAPLLSVCNLINYDTLGGKKFNLHVVSGVDAIKGAIGRKDADIAVCPVNLSATLYNGGVDYKLLSVNVLSSLAVVGKVQTPLENLVNNTIYATGAGGTPDVSFKSLLTALNYGYTENLSSPLTNKINLSYLGNASDVIALLKSDIASYAVLGEPQLSLAIKNANVTKLLDVNELWKSTFNTQIMQAGIVVNDTLLNDKKFLTDFVSRVSETENFISNNYANLKTLLAEKGSNLIVEFQKDSYTNWNLSFLNAYKNKNDIEKYLTILGNYNKNFIGGKLPNADFYVDYDNFKK